MIMSDPIEFPSSTPRFSLPFLFSGQAQKEFFVNEAHAMIDALLHPAIEGMATAPPAGPQEGESWLVGTGATGDWASKDDAIAISASGGWVFVTPTAGLTVYDKSLRQTRHFRTSWSSADQAIAPSGGTTVDIEARATIDQLIQILRTSGIIPEI